MFIKIRIVASNIMAVMPHRQTDRVVLWLGPLSKLLEHWTVSGSRKCKLSQISVNNEAEIYKHKPKEN